MVHAASPMMVQTNQFVHANLASGELFVIKKELLVLAVFLVIHITGHSMVLVKGKSTWFTSKAIVSILWWKPCLV